MTFLLFMCAAAIITAVSYGFSKSAHPYLSAVKSAVTGLSALLMINMVSGVTGCYIAINSRTVFVSTVLSLPGVFALLVMKILFNY